MLDYLCVKIEEKKTQNALCVPIFNVLMHQILKMKSFFYEYIDKVCLSISIKQLVLQQKSKNDSKKIEFCMKRQNCEHPQVFMCVCVYCIYFTLIIHISDSILLACLRAFSLIDIKCVAVVFSIPILSIILLSEIVWIE